MTERAYPIPTEIPLSDPGTVSDIFATELAEVEVLGNNVRFIVACEQRAPDGSRERVVVCRLVVPVEAIPPAIETIMGALPDLEWVRRN